MQLNMTEISNTAFRLPPFALRWSGVFAGLAVGVATNLSLLLLGVTVGLSAFDVGRPTTEQVSTAALVWNTFSLVVAAFVGGYVASRGAGMRRTADGVLHGVVTWGVALLASTLLATSATSAIFGSLLSNSPGTVAATADAVTRLQEGDRQAAIDSLQSRLGLSPEQAGRVVDQALVAAGQPERASPGAREQAQRGVKTLSSASALVTAAVVLSLLAAVGGGLLGARGTRRHLGSPYLARRRAIPATEPAPRTMAPVE